MMVEHSLLDLLAIQMKCEYLSDLRFLTQEQRQYLAQKLDRLTPREEEIRDWNDALNYLTGAPPESTAQAAKAKLVQELAGIEMPHDGLAPFIKKWGVPQPGASKTSKL